MRAAILEQFGAPLILKDLPGPPPTRARSW